MPKKIRASKPPRELPPLSGLQLAKLLLKDGWQSGGMRTHGCAFKKFVGHRTLVTVIPVKVIPLPPGTLGAILGPKQTCLGKAGLRTLIDKYGL